MKNKYKLISIITILMMILLAAQLVSAAHTHTSVITPEWKTASTSTLYTLVVTNNGADSIDWVKITKPVDFGNVACGGAPTDWTLEASSITYCTYTTTTDLMNVSDSETFTVTTTTAASTNTYSWSTRTRDDQEVYVTTNPTSKIDADVPTAALTYNDTDGVFKDEQVVTITATFNEPLADSPKVKLAIDNSELTAAEMTKVTTTSYTYVYTVQAAGNIATATASLSIGTDVAGNVIIAVPTSGATFEIDNSAPTISSTAPAASAFIKTQTASYTLDEAVASGAIIFTRTGGTADGNIHNCTLQGTALNTGAHTGLTLETETDACADWANPLVDGTEYTVTFDATDAADNAATTITNTVVTYDNSAPIFSVTDDVSATWVATDDIVFTVASAAAGAGTTHDYVFTDDATCDGTVTFTSATDFTAAGDTITVNSEDYVNKYICLREDDVAGNMGYQSVGPFKIDTAVASIVVTDDVVGSYVQTDDIIFTMTYGASGAGDTDYVIAADTTCDVSVNFDSATNYVSGDTITCANEATYDGKYLCLRSRDAKGDEGTETYTYQATGLLKIDTSAPTVSFDPDSATWTSTAIDVTITGADGSGSGIAKIYYKTVVKDVSCPNVGVGYTEVTGSAPVEIAISTDGEWEICAYAQDVAENTAGAATKSGVYQYDTDVPTIQSGTYVHSSKVLTLTFDDTLTEATKTKVSIANSNDYPTSGAGFTLGDDDACTQDGSTDATCTLSNANKNTISSWDGQEDDTLYISVGAGAVKDKASQNNTAGITSITGSDWTKDTVAPTYASNTYNTGTGILTITLSENLIAGTSNVNLSKIYIVGSDSTVTYLTGSTVDSVSTATATITLSSLTKAWLNGLTIASSYLRFDAGALQDLAANSIVANVGDNAVTVDSTNPALESVTSYNYATKELTLVFNETIKYSLVNVSEIVIGITATGGNSITLDGATVTTSANSETIVITLTDAQRDIIQDTFGTPSALYIRLGASAVTDLGDNTNDALSTGIAVSTITHKDQIALISGWNLISTPFTMAAAKDTFEELLDGYNYTVYEYSGEWAQEDYVDPLYGYLVNVNQSGVITLSYDEDADLSKPYRNLDSRKSYTITTPSSISKTEKSIRINSPGVEGQKVITLPASLLK
jgi:hypothetical protein